jgi:hypothetical protein
MLQECQERKLTKPTEPRPGPILSVLSVPTLPVSEINAPSASIPPDDPAEWREPFVRWLDSQCALHPRAFGGLVCLHLAFCEWEQARGGVPCTRETFAALLAELGFLIGEIEGTFLVSGLIFRTDAAACSLPKKRLGKT